MGGVGGAFLVRVRNLPLCLSQLDIKWWQCDRNYLLTLLLKLCGLRFGDRTSEKELDEHLGKIGTSYMFSSAGRGGMGGEGVLRGPLDKDEWYRSR